MSGAGLNSLLFEFEHELLHHKNPQKHENLLSLYVRAADVHIFQHYEKGNFEQIFIQSSTFLKVSQQKQDVSSGRGLCPPPLKPLSCAADAETPVSQLGAMMETLAKQWASSHNRLED